MGTVRIRTVPKHQQFQEQDGNISNLDGLGYHGAAVVVTGASSGVGAVARIFGELGTRVHLVDIKPSKWENL